MYRDLLDINEVCSYLRDRFRKFQTSIDVIWKFRNANMVTQRKVFEKPQKCHGRLVHSYTADVLAY